MHIQKYSGHPDTKVWIGEAKRKDGLTVYATGQDFDEVKKQLEKKCTNSKDTQE